MNTINHTMLGDLSTVIRDGKTFYENAATKVDDTELKTLFTRVAKFKVEMLKDLPTEARKTTPIVTDGIVSEVEKLYAEVAPLLEDKPLTWVARLAGSEGRVLKMSENIIADSKIPATERTTLTRFLPEMRSCHERMLAIAA